MSKAANEPRAKNIFLHLHLRTDSEPDKLASLPAEHTHLKNRLQKTDSAAGGQHGSTRGF